MPSCQHLVPEPFWQIERQFWVGFAQFGILDKLFRDSFGISERYKVFNIVNKVVINVGHNAQKTKMTGVRDDGKKSEIPTNNDINIGVNNDAIDCEITGVYTSEAQNLAEAAAEIQELLEQLARTNPTTTEALQVVEQKIEHNPTLKERLRGALKAGCSEAVKAAFDHPLVHIPFETIKGFIEAD